MFSRAFCTLLALSAFSMPVSAQYFQQFSSVSNPVSTVFADVNGDGKADAIYVDDGLQVKLSGQTTATSYALSTTAFSGVTEAQPLVQDFNGDGHPDIIVPRGNGFDVFLNNGNGTFGAATPYITDDDFTTFVVADMNNDGKPDIIYIAGTTEPFDTGGLHAGDIAIALNTGSGLLKSNYFPLSGPPASLATGDLNGDGKLDVVVAGTFDTFNYYYDGSPLTYFLNNGNGGLGSPHVIPSIVNPALAVADINGDGFADIIATDYDQVVIAQGNAFGDLSISQRLFFDGAADGTFTVADLNGDGHPDIFTGGEEPPSVALNDGAGKFGAFVSYFQGGYNPRLADIDGDGLPDLVWDKDVTTMTTETVSTEYALNKGNGTFAAPQSASSYALVFGDFNGDGLLDSATWEDSVDTAVPYLTFELANGDGTFRHVRGPALGPYYPILNSGDVNGDGKPDIVVANYLLGGSGGQTKVVLTTCLNGGGASFTCGPESQVSLTGTYGVSYQFLADITGKGSASFLFVSNNVLYAAKTNGNGTFAQAKALLTTTDYMEQIVVGDFNGDGIPDLFIYFGNDAELYLGSSSGTYTASASLEIQNIVAVADLNGDGYPDVIAQENIGEGAAATATLLPYFGSKQGTFTAAAAVTTDFSSYSYLTAFAGDINGDGIVDLLASDGELFEVLLNDGKGNLTLSQTNFSAGSDFRLGHANSAALAAGSKKLDILTSDDGIKMTALLNLGNTQPAVAAISRVEIAISANPVVAGQNATLTATVSAATGSGTPQGTVSFWNNAMLLATVPVSNGKASVTFSTAGVPAGPYTLSASFKSSNTAFQNSESSWLRASLESGGVHQTQTFVSDNFGIVTTGSTFVVTAYVVPVAASGTPTGTVTFYGEPAYGSDSTPDTIGAAALSNGKASLTFQVPSGIENGEYVLFAKYSGGGSYAASNSSPFTNPIPDLTGSCSLALNSPPASGSVGSPFTVTANATTSESFDINDLEPVLYLDGVEVARGSSEDNSETTATYTFSAAVPALATGAHKLTAHYAGDGNSAPCTSAATTFTVN